MYSLIKPIFDIAKNVYIASKTGLSKFVDHIFLVLRLNVIFQSERIIQKLS